jgi:predicted dehydrogenase
MQYQIEAQRPVRIGVVGVGSHCYRNILPTLTYLPVQLIAVADLDLDRATAVGRQYNAQAYTSAGAMYEAEDLDAVLLCVSAKLHPQLAIEAFGAGLHVWMEKPAAMRASGVEAMLAARGDNACVVSYKKAFMPATRKAVELMALEGHAQLRSLLGVYPLALPEDGPAVLAEGRKSAWLSNGCHPLALMLELGGAVEAVTTHRSKHDGGACILHYASGAIGNLHLPKGAPNTQPCERYLLAAGNHSIEIENSRRVIYQRGIDFSYTHGTSFAQGDTNTGAVVWEAQDGLNSPETMSVVTQGIHGALDHFIASVAAGRQPTIGNLEFALSLTRVWEAVLLSQGKTVALEQG